MMKVQTDFSAYALLDIVIDIDQIQTEVESIFGSLKEKEKEAELEKAKLARAAAYDQNYFLCVLKPELEELGHKVVASCTKEEAVEKGRDVGLIVNGRIHVGRDYKGYVQVVNVKYSDERVEKSTKSSKTEKIIETVKWVIEVDEIRRVQKAEKLKKLAGAKEKLEKILGISVVEKKEYHSNQYGSRRSSTPGYETSYFIDAKFKV